MSQRLLDHLREVLSPQPIPFSSKWTSRPAAILIPLLHHKDTWHLLYTRRTEHVPSHRGQVSFPGGVIETQDLGPREAALREAREEIGLEPESVEILGFMRPHPTVTGYVITPMVGKIPWPYPLQLNHFEVASCFIVPIKWLADPARYRIQRTFPGPDGLERAVYEFEPFQGEVIWGATARITIELMQMIFSGLIDPNE